VAFALTDKKITRCLVRTVNLQAQVRTSQLQNEIMNHSIVTFYRLTLCLNRTVVIIFYKQ
jgi:hypothetical protein